MVLALTLGACGDDDSGGADGSTGSGAASSSTTTPVSGTETTATATSTSTADDSTSSSVGSTTDATTGSGSTDGTTGTGTTGSGTTGEPVPFELMSTAYAEGEMIPVQYECGPPVSPGPGDNLSPPLSWTPGPAGTQSYAFVMRDIDAASPQEPDGLIHWVLYDVPADTLQLPEAIPPGYEVADPAGARQAELQMVFFGYLGPCSPDSINTYVITVHAIDTATLPGVDMDTPETEIAALVEMTAIASASLSGES